MRILILGDIRPLDKIRSCSGVYGYYFRREFLAAGHDVVTATCGTHTMSPEETLKFYADLPGADHCLCTEQRGFYNRCIEFTDMVRAKIPGCVSTMCDHNALLGLEDMTFYTVPGDHRNKSVCVGWCADGELCYPDKGKKTILVDHSYYNGMGPGAQDYSQKIVYEAWRFAKDNGWEIRRFISGGVETTYEPWTDIYNRQGTTYLEACAEYRKAHVFLVTHVESMGLSVLESAMSGALIVSPAGFIKRGLIGDLDHKEWGGNIPWDYLKTCEFDPQGTSDMAQKYNRWPELAGMVLDTFSSWGE